MFVLVVCLTEVPKLVVLLVLVELPMDWILELIIPFELPTELVDLPGPVIGLIGI